MGTIGSFLSSAGGGGIIGGLIGGIGNAYGAYQSGKDAREMQARQIAWERERAQNAHQWEVKDLEAAGLNPILSAGGSGAQTGGISAPTIDRSGYGAAGESILHGITTALDAKRQAKEAEQIDADIQQKSVQNSFIAAQTLTEAYKQGLISKQTAAEATRAQLMGVQTKQIEQIIWQEKQKFDYTLQELHFKIELAKKQNRLSEAQALQEEYNATKRKLTYWNSQVNIATKSIQNLTTSTAAVVGALNPGHFIGNFLKNLKETPKPSGYTRY